MTDPAPVRTDSAVRQRDLGIESLRAIAIVLMVGGHVIGNGATAGMQVADDSWWRYSYLFLEDARMPLFTALSGFVYAYRPVRPGAFTSMVQGKGRRLLVPLLTTGVVFYLLQVFTPGANNPPPVAEVWRVPVEGYGHFWFVQALFWIFCVVGLLDRAGVLEDLGRWTGVTALSVALYLYGAPFGLTFFSVNSAVRLLPFFLLGYGLHRFGSILTRSGWTPTVVVALLVSGLAMRTTEVLGASSLNATGGRALSLVVGASAVWLLIVLRSRVANRYLAWVGQFAFAVYLLHVFGAAGARLVMNQAGVQSSVVVFVVATGVAVVLPVVFEMTVGRVAVISWAFLGQRPWKPNVPRDFDVGASGRRAP